jgi:chromosome partitioning protein
VLPTDIRLSAAEIELVNADRRNYLLKDALGKLKKSYDFIIIDSPPSLNILTLMALTAATEVIIPVQAMYLPLKGEHNSELP